MTDELDCKNFDPLEPIGIHPASCLELGMMMLIECRSVVCTNDSVMVEVVCGCSLLTVPANRLIIDLPIYLLELTDTEDSASTDVNYTSFIDVRFGGSPVSHYVHLHHLDP